MSDTAKAADDAATASGEQKTSENSDEVEKNVKNIQRCVVDAVKSANLLPKLSEGYELFASFPLYAQFMNEQEKRVLSLDFNFFFSLPVKLHSNFSLRSVMRQAGCSIRLPSKIVDIDELIDSIAEGNDSIVEKVGILLDQLSKNANAEKLVVPELAIGAEHIPDLGSGVANSSNLWQPGSAGRYAALSIRAKALSAGRLNESSTSAASTPGTPPSLETVFSTPCLSAAKRRIIRLSSPFLQKVLVKPQLAYSIPVDNSDREFVSKLKQKHNARNTEQPEERLRIRDEQQEGGDCSGRLEWNSDQQETENEHPYKSELDGFEIPASQLQLGERRQVKALEDTELVMVDTIEKLEKVRDELNASSAFAVDLEHHSYRSFQGLTCLLQISTSAKDYIIDPFPVWNEMHILNDPFTNPNILKVFHGSEHDVRWLQRDFGIYVVGMFDTYCAMHVLSFERFSLAHLVQSICNVVLDKELQKADWRVRPLSAAHLEYARSDTHYLLHCYDVLRQQLINRGNETKNLLRTTYNESVLLCRNVYEKPKFDAEGYEVLLRGRKSFNSRQLYALRELWKWRDERARAEDESLEYVLPNYNLLQIAEVLPREAQGILACCSPIPPLVKQELITLHRIVYAARDRPLELRPTLNLNQATLTFESFETQRSKMTKQKAILRSHLDFSMTKFDEEISTSRSIDVNAEELSKLISLKKSAELSLADCQLPATMSTDLQKMVVDENKEKGEEASDHRGEEEVCADKSVYKIGPEVELENEKREQLREELSQWATPYECFVIAVKERQTRETEASSLETCLKEKAKADAQKNAKSGDSVEKNGTGEEGGEGEKKLWSHLDPASERPVFLEKKEDISASEMRAKRQQEAEAAIGMTEEMTLTKKALKRKHKFVSTTEVFVSVYLYPVQ
ncbi:unnamed protein product [Anisakis simplex]|uniref:Exosome complex component 10 homolog n=1 Tax=Anisakis simplex TaxID=6269 RepID=A0A0M3IYX5_ANISI|nr:unnamed protein product [Anisakis simplex]